MNRNPSNVFQCEKMEVSTAVASCLGLSIGASVLIFVRRFNLLYQLLHTTQKTSKEHGGTLVANVLKSHDIKAVFTLPGGHISPIAVACEKLGIKVIDTRHEVTAAFAADAYARVGRGIGVVMVTAGPGLTNVITALKNAQMAESPVLLLGGAAASLLKGRGALQDIDQMSLFKPVCKHVVSVTKVRDIVPTLREAIKIAQSGVPAPVFVELPVDTLYPYEMIKKEVGIKDSAKGLVQKIVNWYLNNYLNDMFCGAFEERNTEPLDIDIPKASNSQIQTAAQLLSKAKKPVILMGSQATIPPCPINTTVVALETMGAPCFLSGMARGMLGRNNPIHIRQNRSQVLKEADLIILAGTVADFRLNYGRSIGRQAKVISVNRGKELMKLNSDMFWKPTLGVVGDAADFIARVQAALPGYRADPTWAEGLKKREVEKEEQFAVKSKLHVDRYLNPLDVLFRVEEQLDSNSIIVADGGDFVATASYILRPRGPLQWLDPGPFGTLGVGAGFALGAKTANPDAQIWIIYGDGSLGYSIIEYDTFRRHKIPVLSVVGNDACWTQIAREQLPMLGSTIGCMLEFSSYEKVAEALGAHGVLLKSPGEDDIDGALVECKKVLKEEKSALMNCFIGKTDFRDGSISI